MSRRRNPLPAMTDSQVLKAAARSLVQGGGLLRGSATMSAKTDGADPRDLACRLRQLARRVPLWTDRAWEPETPSPYDLGAPRGRDIRKEV